MPGHNWLTPCAAYTTLSEAHAHGEGLHAHIPQMSHEGVSDDGPGAKDSPGKVDERRAARSASKRKPRDDPTPGEKGDAAGRENDAGSTPQKVLKKVPMNSPGGTVTANAEECLAVVNLGGNGHAVGEAVADAGRVERSKHPAVADDRRWLGPKGTINRTEYVALIEQALCRMGYDDVAASLRERTGVSHRTEAGAAFERLVLTGRWSEAVESLFVLAREANARAVDPTPDAATEMEARSGDGDGVEDRDEDRDEELELMNPYVKHCMLLIHEQHYMELLNAGNKDASWEALELLRGKIAPMFNLPGVKGWDERLERRKRRGERRELNKEFLGGAERMHNIASLIAFGGVKDELYTVFSNPESAPSKKWGSPWGPWLGKTQAMRDTLWERILLLMPPEVLVPPARLETLVEQALEYQMDKCQFHNAPAKPLTLYKNYSCGKEQLPIKTVQRLAAHADEVWHLAFSHDGKRLASGSKDGSVVVYDVLSADEVRVRHTLRVDELKDGDGQEADISDADGPGDDSDSSSSSGRKPVAFLLWSPDDSYVVSTAGNAAYVWNAETGDLHATCAGGHVHHITAAAWWPDGSRLVTCGLDKAAQAWTLDGVRAGGWHSARMNDIAITHDGKYAVSICMEQNVTLRRLGDGREFKVKETDNLMSLSLSADSTWLLVNLSNSEIHLWDVNRLIEKMEEEERAAIPVWKRPDLRETRPVKDPVPLSPSMTFRLGRAPGRGGRFVTRSCFGGGNQAFVMAGGEDASLYIFHRKSGAQLCEIPGHFNTINTVSWNPSNPFMAASGSDDCEVRIWVAAVASTKADLSHKDLPPFLFPEPPKVLGEPPKVPGEGGSGMVGRMSRDWATGAKEEPAESEIKEEPAGDA